MTEKADSLGAAFALTDEDEGRLREQIRESRCMKELGGRFGGALPQSFWAAAADRVVESLAEMMDTPLSGILAGAWSRYAPFLEFCDPERHPPQETSVVPLAEHTVHSQHRPGVELVFEGAVAGKVEFDVAVAVTLEGAAIAVRGGRIMELRPGTTRVEAALFCEGIPILRREREIELPGVVRFGEGVPIAAAVPVHGVPISRAPEPSPTEA